MTLDLTSKRFGRLVALEFAGKNSDFRTRWRCLCDCGNTAVVATEYLRAGKTRSCGCLLSDTARAKLAAVLKRRRARRA